MDVQDYFEFIDEISIRIKGHRVYIDEVLEERLQGKEPEEILCCFPKLPLEKIYATLLSRAIQEQLREMHVRLIGDAGVPPLGTPDPDILTWIERNNYILVTNNRTTIPSHLTEHLQGGGHVPGILCFPQRTSIGTYVKELRRVWNSFTPEQYQDVIQYLP